MESIEYLLVNLEPKYSIFPITIPALTTIDKGAPFMLQGKLYCTGSIIINRSRYNLIRDSSSDGAIIYGLPNAIDILIAQPFIRKLIDWINNNLFIQMLTNDELAQTKTELVKLRIAVNKIMELRSLDISTRRIWSSWIQELYWERKKVLHKWYLEYILPF